MTRALSKKLPLLGEASSPWVGASFCGFISIGALTLYFMSRIIGATQGGAIETALIPFLSFLPMCFVFVAGCIRQMQKEIGELRERLEKLNGGE